jgi:hypothetical protein
MLSMKRFGTAVAAASLLMAVTGAGSASAANWDPANTTRTAHGTLTLDENGQGVTCTYHSGVRSAGGADAFTTTPAGTTPAPPTFSNCSTTIPGSTATVTSSAAWTFTATSTTSVDVTNGNAVITIRVFGVDVCTITAANASVPNNTWSNATSTLTPSASTFSVTNDRAACPGGVGAFQARMTGSVAAPGVTIT